MFELLLTIYFGASFSSFDEQQLPEKSIPLETVAPPIKTLDTTLTPRVSAFSYLLGDVTSGDVYSSKKQDNVLAMASLTKIMTAVVALERYEIEELVTMTNEAAAIPGAKVYVYPKDILTVREMLFGLLIRSGNDIAVALAQHAPGGEQQFVSWMNEKTKEIGMTQTHFTNPTGLDDPLHYTTAKDLFLLSRYALHTHPLIREIVAQKEHTLLSENGFTYPAISTNQLLGSFLPIVGFKTGTTDNAGESYIALLQEEGGRETLLVLLNSEARFQEAKTILWWFLHGGNLPETNA